MGFFDLFKKKDSYKEVPKKTITNLNDASYNIQINAEIDPIYYKKLSNGLLPGEIVLLDWIDGTFLTDTKFPQYFEYEYGINTENSLKKLISNGFVEYAGPEEALFSLTVNSLKQILRSKSLKVSGRKADLIERIKDNFTISEIENLVKDKPLKVTATGKNILKEYDYIVSAHKFNSKDGVYNVASAIRFVKASKTKLSNSEISWSLFQMALDKHLKSKQYGLARNDFFNMASQLYREKRFVDSLEYFLRVFICDLSGLSSANFIFVPKQNIIAPGVVLKISQIVTALEDENDNSTLKTVFENSWNNTRPILPFHFLNKESCFQCLLAALEENDEYIQNAIFESYKKLDKKMLEKKYNLVFLNYDV